MKLKVGIIGLGVGESHINGYSEHSDCDVVTLCDFKDEKINLAKEKYPNKKITKDANDVLDDPDINVISIASYDNYHYEQIMRAINNDKHVFVEKPLCLYKKEALNIRKRLNKKPHLKLSSNLILRKSPRFIWLKEKIDKGDMGELFHIEGDYNYGRFHKISKGWRGKIDFYSVIYGGGVHMIDLLLWLTDDDVSEVATYGNNVSSKNTQFRYNDSTTSILKFKSGITGKISVHYACVRPHFHNLSVYGTKATFVNHEEYGSFYDSMDPKKEVKKINEPYPGVHKGDLIYSFVESIMNNAPSVVSKKDVFKSMSVCFAMEKSMQDGKPVLVKYI